MIEQYKEEAKEGCDHAGRVYETVAYAVSEAMDVPKYLVRGRMIQIGYWQAQGALNYIQTSPASGRYIVPFMFSRESCPTTAHTFFISPKDSFKLYEANADYRTRIDTGNYVYVEGHICLNDPAYVIQTPLGPRMSDWANRHVDECCLRFENVYEVDENYEFHLNFINSDEEYNRHYIDFVAQGKDLTLKEITELQSSVIASLPCKPGEALKALMKMSGDVSQEKLAELTLMSRGAVRNWMNEEYTFRPETAIRIIIGLHLPPWLSKRFLDICGVTCQYHGLHLIYRNILDCHYFTEKCELRPKAILN